MKQPKVLIGLSEVAGHYKGLKLGFERLGIKCTFVNFSEHPFSFDADDKIWPVRWVQKVDANRRVLNSRGARVLMALLQGVLQGILFLRVLPGHNVFIYCANRNFIGFLDLFILRFLGKKIIYQMHGCDSRAPYIDGAYNEADLLPDSSLYRLTRIKKFILKITETFANVVVNVPPQAHLCEKEYINWLYVGLCCYPLDYEVAELSAMNEPGKLRIVHSPSKPGAKGTPIIRNAVKRLEQRGISVDYIELIGVSNKKVIEEVRRADLVIDQIYADYAMPGFATEAAWQGKPVLICGYAVDFWAKWMKKEDLPPTHYCHPDNFEDELFRLASDSNLRDTVGKRMYEYVSSNWRPEQIAANYLKVLDSPPKHWWLDPKDNDYINGCAISEERLKFRLSNYLNHYGVKGLQLDDKHELVKEIYRFVKSN